ncbi:MAG: hypothetical protein M3169_15965 [Candidatus Eremiobacteraeota bacterium]|nr:hypothetical protein [Candidatus Eremiobacteraeota bacterium]
MPTREDVLAIQTIEEAFDLWTPAVTKRELMLIRVAARWNLLMFTLHAVNEADDELIPLTTIRHVVEHARITTKDIDSAGKRSIGINFEGTLPDRRRIRAKVSWERGYFIVTVHTTDMVK